MKAPFSPGSKYRVLIQGATLVYRDPLPGGGYTVRQLDLRMGQPLTCVTVGNDGPIFVAQGGCGNRYTGVVAPSQLGWTRRGVLEQFG